MVGATWSRSRDYASLGSIPFSIRRNVGNRAIWAATRRASSFDRRFKCDWRGRLVFEVDHCQVQAGGVPHFISAIALGDAPRSHEAAGLGWSRFANRYFLRALHRWWLLDELSLVERSYSRTRSLEPQRPARQRTAPFFDVYGCIIQNQPDHRVVALRIPKASDRQLPGAVRGARGSQELVGRNVANTISRSA